MAFFMTFKLDNHKSMGLFLLDGLGLFEGLVVWKGLSLILDLLYLCL